MNASMLCPAIAGAAFLMLEGCAQTGRTLPESSSIQNPPARYSSTQQIGPFTQQIGPLKKAVRGLYIDQGGYGGNTVDVYGAKYRKNKKPACSIPMASFATDVTADALGNMYVINDPNYYPPGSINVYGPHCGSLIASVSEPYGLAATIVLHGSIWYVDNYYDANRDDDSGNVAVCSQSAGCYADLTVPPSNPLAGELFGAGVDRTGNVFADGYTQTSGQTYLGIFEWANGQNPGKLVYNLPKADVDNSGGALVFDNAGNIIVGGTDKLYVLTGCPSACVTNGPFDVTQFTGAEFALNRNGTELFFANYVAGSVDVYRYNGASTPTYLYSITNGLNKGSNGLPAPIAVTPVPPNTQ
jgi:hypothetical protein